MQKERNRSSKQQQYGEVKIFIHKTPRCGGSIHEQNKKNPPTQVHPHKDAKRHEEEREGEMELLEEEPHRPLPFDPSWRSLPTE